MPNSTNVPATGGRVARVDLNNLTASGVVTLDLTLEDRGLKGFQGGFTDDRYGYFVPFNDGAYDGKLVRVDLQNFTLDGVRWVDLSAIDRGLKGFGSGFTDGRFAYLVPQFNGAYDGRVARIQLFASTSAP